MKKIIGALTLMLSIAISCVPVKAETSSNKMEIIPSETVEIAAGPSFERRTLVVVIIDGDDVIVIIVDEKTSK